MNKKIELTFEQCCLLRGILGSVTDAMQFDEEDGCYLDGGRFIFSMSKTEYNVFKRLVDKIN